MAGLFVIKAFLSNEALKNVLTLLLSDNQKDYTHLNDTIIILHNTCQGHVQAYSILFHNQWKE